jgi:hypothetical protein
VATSGKLLEDKEVSDALATYAVDQLYANQAFGNVRQTRGQSGFVKAMAYVDPGGHPGDPIRQCFNSQLPPSQATSGNCDILYSSTGTGRYDLDFIDSPTLPDASRYVGEAAVRGFAEDAMERGWDGHWWVQDILDAETRSWSSGR